MMEKIGLKIEFPAPNGDLRISFKRLKQIIEREEQKGATHLQVLPLMEEHYFKGVTVQPVKN